jgi:hypothetical protein
MKRSEILGIDALASMAIILWFMLGPWIHLYGFDLYHSRGDVWLTTPAPAIQFFHGLVLSGCIMLSALFIAASSGFFLLGRLFDASGRLGIVSVAYRAFYGDGWNLVAKYSALLMAFLSSPYLYDWMWLFHVTREGRIFGGFGMSVGIFVIAMVLSNMMRRSPHREPLPA